MLFRSDREYGPYGQIEEMKEGLGFGRDNNGLIMFNEASDASFQRTADPLDDPTDSDRGMSH